MKDYFQLFMRDLWFRKVFKVQKYTFICFPRNIHSSFFKVVIWEMRTVLQGMYTGRFYLERILSVTLSLWKKAPFIYHICCLCCACIKLSPPKRPKLAMVCHSAFAFWGTVSYSICPLNIAVIVVMLNMKLLYLLSDSWHFLLTSIYIVYVYYCTV